MSAEARTVCIVGGGMTGLTLAYRLSRRGIRAAVYEQSAYLGGLSSESELSGIPVERFYHCVLPTDTTLLSLLDELSLTDDIGWTKTRTGFFHDARLLEMTSTLDFLRFPALQITDRLRLAWTILFCAVHQDWRAFDTKPVGVFLRLHGGERLFRSIWEPLLLAKLGPEYDRFSASFIWATINRMMSARKAKNRSERLGYVRGRYGKVLQALRHAIEYRGGAVLTGMAVDGISAGDKSGTWVIHSDAGTSAPSEVVLCVPGPTAAPWLLQFNPDASQALGRLDYLGIVCETLLLKRSVTPYYVLNLTDRSLPFSGVIEMTNLTGISEFGGHTLVYVPRYADQHSSVWKKSDEQIHDENVQGLLKINPDLVPADIAGWRMERARCVQPIHRVGEGARMPPVRIAPGLSYLSTAQIHPWPVFNDMVVRHVDASLQEVLSPG